jgi:hypothetical protein
LTIRIFPGQHSEDGKSIRSQMLYPLSYERGCLASLRHSGCALRQHFAAHSPAAARVAATDADIIDHLAQTRRCSHMAGSGAPT